MTQTRSRSTRHEPGLEAALVSGLPTSLSADVAAEAARLMARAEAMGLVVLAGDHTLDLDLLAETLRALARVGIGRQVLSRDDVALHPGEALEELNRSLLDSPHPDTEWGAVTAVLGTGLACRLLGVGPSSVKRYSSAERRAPDAVVHRLHATAMVIADLLGAYNAYGVRRWFDRPRRALDGHSPAEVLSGDWSPDDPGPTEVAGLARSLTAIGAT